MRIVEIRQEAELQDLRGQWERLLVQSASQTIFLTWEWMTAWWSAYGKVGALRILAAFDGDRLVGIAPLRAESLRRYGQTVPALLFIGDGSNDSDYLDFIIAAGCEDQVMRAFLDHIASSLHGGTVLQLNEIPESSPNLLALKSLGDTADMIAVETDVPCGTVRLPASWDDYLGMLRPRFRTKVRSVLRNLENRPEIRFGFCEDESQVRRLLPTMFDLHAKRWAQEGKPGVFGWDQKRRFYFEVSPLLLDRKALKFSWLEWNGRILACQYGFTYGDTYFQLQEGYEPASEHWNVGVGLRAWTIREFLRAGMREYDFLGGVGRHKSDWGAQTKQSKRFLFAAPTPKNILFCRGPEWETRARESAKKLVPDVVLDARAKKVEERRLAAVSQSDQPNGKEWLRSTIANCYLHLQLPALVHPVRDRYQLAVKPNGLLPKLSFSKRLTPSARILYFHRVNNDNDRFFPSISTELFEQEMKFVSRHYTVVSLAAMLDHLSGNSPEPVLAITFDDGYKDNYEQAFPILQRYGLPATIFLTTGGLDSGEPLWFEQLALAIKKTTKEFIDLEIELPQRYWMRTEEERLTSNDAIFGRLRSLPDSDRRLWMKEILRQLAVVETGERKNKMLSWDEVRTMKSKGIDFGGHTVTHPFLSRQPKEQVAWEVSECKRRIEQEIQQPVSFFAYPNGREEDFGSWNKEVIAAAGYRAAVTTIWGVNYASTDPMELRRGGPWEPSVARFAYKLDWYQLVND